MFPIVHLKTLVLTSRRQGNLTIVTFQCSCRIPPTDRVSKSSSKSLWNYL